MARRARPTTVSSDPPSRPAGLPPFSRVVEAHGAAVLRFCVARAGPNRAEDVFQETMIAALRAYGDVRDAGAVRSWLLSIAARKAVDADRAAARAPRPVEDLEALAVSAEAEHRDEALWAEVRALPDKQRQAVTLRYLADLSHREIGEVMRTSEDSARRSVFEGLRRLRRDR